MAEDVAEQAEDEAAPAARSRPSSTDKPRRMTEEDLITLIGQYEKNCLGSEVAAGSVAGDFAADSAKAMTTLEVDRYNALNAYYGRPLGNEIETSSTVVVPEFRDTVEWIMPQLARIFLAATSACSFDPEGPDDVEASAEETAAVNHVFMRLNPGFFVIHDYCKDAMMLRNGYVRVDVEEVTEPTEETYTGLTEESLTQLLSDKEAPPQNEMEMEGEEPRKGPEVEVIGQREYTMKVPAPLDAPPGTPDQDVTVFDVRLRIKKTVKRIVVEAIPPEEMRIAAGTRSNDLDRCAFVQQKIRRTRSALVAEGYPEEEVYAATAIPDDWFEMDALARNQVLDQMQLNPDETEDKSQQELEVRNTTIQVDFDGDGVSERRQVVLIGNKVFSNDIIEECPVASGVPKRMPHRHTGISLYDELIDLQVINSELVRQGLNGLRLSLNPRVGVDWKNCSLSDLMTWRSGGVVRTNGNPQSVLFPFQSPTNTIDQIRPMLDITEQWRVMRTGVGQKTMGLDADALQDVTKGAQLAAMSAASLKIEMVARLLAEGLKDVFLKIHALLIRHQDEPMQFQIGKEWKQTDPRKWRKRTRVSPNVGLGSGNREEARANMALLGTMMKEAGGLGLVGPKQGYNFFKMGCSLLGYEHPEEFAMDPASDEFKQAQAAKQNQPPDPKVQAAAIKAKADAADTEARVQIAKMEQQTENERAQAEVAHAALQGREDRQVTLAGQDAQLATKLLEIISKVVASQLSKDPGVNAGAVLREDLQTLEGRGA